MPLLWQAARSEAQNIRKASNIGNTGLADLIKIASKWEASVSVVPLEPGLSGFIIKEADSTPRIYINSGEPVVRQRFTLAHEIGHLVDRNVIARDPDYSFVDRRGAKYDLHEFFADEFAGELLMPEAKIKQWEAAGKSDYEIAEQLGVSVIALNKRMERLRKNPSNTEEHLVP